MSGGKEGWEGTGDEWGEGGMGGNRRRVEGRRDGREQEMSGGKEEQEMSGGKEGWEGTGDEWGEGGMGGNRR